MDITTGGDFSWSLRPKVDISMDLVLTGYGVVVFFIVVKALLWNWRLKSNYATLNQMEQEQSAEAATRNSRCSHPSGSVTCGWRWHFENLLKTKVYVNWRQIHEVGFNLCFKFIRYYAYFLFCFTQFQKSLSYIFFITSGHNSVTARNRTHVFTKFLIIQTKEVISCINVQNS